MVDPLLDPNFRTRYGVSGAEFGVAGNTYAYVEARIFDDSVGPQGEEGFDVFIIGLHYGFSIKRRR